MQFPAQYELITETDPESSGKDLSSGAYNYDIHQNDNESVLNGDELV